MKVDVHIPDGQSGDWEISTFEITKDGADFHNLREAMHRSNRFVTPGFYKKITRNNEVIMSNTESEIQDHLKFVEKAKGNVLINGLGLGVVLEMIKDKPEVDKIFVIEKSEDVIKLVAPYFENYPKITIINADAFEYEIPEGMKYGAVWHDIWDYICADNLEEMDSLHYKYEKVAKWQGSWCKRECSRLNY